MPTIPKLPQILIVQQDGLLWAACMLASSLPAFFIISAGFQHFSQEIARVTSLQEQNAQLKALINQYLNAKVNDELIVPPAATIAMNQQAAQTSAEG